MKESDLQEKVTEFQHLKQQIDQSQKQAELINQQILEFKTIKSTLEEVAKNKKDTKMLIPLGAGIFLHASLEDTKNVMMNVGSEVSVPKDIPEAIILIEKQISELKDILLEIETQFQQSVVSAQELQSKIQELSSEKQ